MQRVIELVIEHIPYDVFTDYDLMTLCEGSPDRRYGLVKRAIARDEILHIQRGLYCLAPKYRRHGMYLFQVAQRIYGPSYISFESALSYHGWIPEAVYTTTSASMKKSKDVKTPLGFFSFQRIPSSVFYMDVTRVEPQKGCVFFVARPFKALVDYVYTRKKNWVGLEPLIESLRIELEDLQEVSLEELDRLKQNYKSRRIKRFIEGVKKELEHEH